MALLTSPITINRLTLSNRLVMPPMAVKTSGEDGAVTDALCDYYAERAAGGFLGLIITEHSFISPEGRANKKQVSIAGPETLPGLQRLVQTIHQGGCKVMAQLSHAGSAAPVAQPLSASAVAHPQLSADAPLPRAMERGDLQKVVDDFASAAARAKAAGYDGVELHSAHGYLLNQFYSPLTNHRTDEYGGTLSGRIRLHLEVIRAVRETVGADYPLALRLGGCDYMAGGSTIADAVQAARAFQAAGVDLLDLSGGFCFYTHPHSQQPGYFSDLSLAVKAAVSVPVLLTGGVAQAQDAERLLAEQKADLIGVGRALLRDSRWAEKALAALA